ncbi:MAG: CinA family protein [Candidatus Sericytochromatia bacterium]|nr:CinA family protein [Candidatus Sericytochromatia bacterium]
MTTRDLNTEICTQVQQIHRSAWRGSIEDVASGGLLSAWLQREAGASDTLWQALCSYAREAQLQRYGDLSDRAVSAAAVQHWAAHNLQTDPHFFSLALSGVLRSGAQSSGDQHAWLALQLSDGRSWCLHLRCLAETRADQQAALARLALNLLWQLATSDDLLVAALPQALQAQLEIDVWQALHLPVFEQLKQSLALFAAGWTPLLLFQPDAQGGLLPQRYLDTLRDRHLLVHKGAFNPVTRAHLAMVDTVHAQLHEALPLLEISPGNLDKAEASHDNLAHRLQMLAWQPWPLAVSRWGALYQMREGLVQRGCARQVDFICGEDLYARVFVPRYYTDLPGGADEGLTRLFDGQTRLWVCQRPHTPLPVDAAAEALRQRWAAQCQLLPFDWPMASSAVRAAIASGVADGSAQLQPEVAAYIQEQGLYQAEA